jgi:MFS family permease
VREPARPVQAGTPVPVSAVFGILAAKRSFWFLALGAACSSMCGYGVAFWLPSLLMRSFGLDLLGAGQFLGGLLLLGGVAGVLLGGFLGDAMGNRDKAWFAWVPAISYVIGMPLFVVGVLSSSVGFAFALFLIPQALVYVWLGPVLTAVQHLVPPHMRASASATFLLINNLVGLGLGSWSVGALSDALTPTYGQEALRYAIVAALGFYLLAGLFMALAGKALRKDWVTA